MGDGLLLRLPDLRNPNPFIRGPEVGGGRGLVLVLQLRLPRHLEIVVGERPGAVAFPPDEFVLREIRQLLRMRGRAVRIQDRLGGLFQLDKGDAAAEQALVVVEIAVHRADALPNRARRTLSWNPLDLRSGLHHIDRGIRPGALISGVLDIPHDQGVMPRLERPLRGLRHADRILREIAEHRRLPFLPGEGDVVVASANGVNLQRVLGK